MTGDCTLDYLLIGYNDMAGFTYATIPPPQENINGQSKYFITNKEKSDFLNFYFSSISRVNEDNVLLPDLRMKSNKTLNSISINY